MGWGFVCLVVCPRWREACGAVAHLALCAIGGYDFGYHHFPALAVDPFLEWGFGPAECTVAVGCASDFGGRQ